jgi:hypothetical protein
MKWSVHLKAKQYVAAHLQALPAVLYIYFAVVAVLLGLVGFPFAVGGRLGVMALFFLMMIGVYLIAVAARLRRIKRLTGTDVMEYELTADALCVRIGKDTASIPLSALKIRRLGKSFISVKRSGTWVGIAVLFFEDPATLEQAKMLLQHQTAKS